MSCGRIRKSLNNGFNQLVDMELKNLKMGVLKLEQGQEYILETFDTESACVLVYGECEITINNKEKHILGPRKNPFEDLPYGVFVTKKQQIKFVAKCDSLIGIGSSPAKESTKNTFITPEDIGGGKRGRDNWERNVRFVCWSDNTEGNMLIAGETVTPSGNWSTIPPHRHQYDIPGEEVPYEETYFFQFSKSQGYGLGWQFDDEYKMDQAFSLKTNDVLYMDKGYHPTACGPGVNLYHLTFISGPYRISKSKIHKDFEFLLDENKMKNPYASQKVK